MDELTGRLMAVADLDAEAARRVVEIELAFLKDQGDADKVDEMLQRIPGGSAVTTPDAGRFRGMTGAMSALGALQSQGLDMAGIRTASKEIIAFAREHAGEDIVDGVVHSVPLLRQIM